MLVIVTVLVYFRPLSRPIASTVGDESSLENSEIVVSVPQADHYVDVPRAGARSLLYALEPETALVKPETELVVDLDGTITLRHKSERVLWSFATGSPIYSSYQAPIAENDKENVSDLTTGFFLDFWDDWTLYAHDKHHGALNLSMTAEEFVKITPHVSHDGVILGSKTTTVFVIDGKTGTLVRSYKSPYSPSQSPTDTGASTLLINNHYDNELVRRSSGNAAALPLYITRTDYKLEYFGLNSSKLLWNLKIAHFGAALLCQDIEMPLRENNLNSSHGPGSEINNDFDMPLSCQSKIDIRRQHKSKLSTKVLPKSSNAVPISQASIDGSLNNKHETKLLLAFDPDLPSQSNTEKVSSFDQNNGDVYGKVDMLAERKAYNDESTVFFSPHLALTFILFIFVLVGFVFYCRIHVAKEQDILKGCPGNSNLNAVASKRKKSRKSGKNNSGVEKKDEDITSGNYDALPFTDSYNNKLLDLNELAKGGANGRKIGKLFVSNTEIAKGSNGTIVLEGFYDGRSVAVKRLVRSHYEVAFKEIQNLIASDQHPNIVRWYGVEYDQDFVYLCLERCICSLGDLVPNHSDSLYPVSSENQVMKAITGYTIRLDSVKGILQDINLWKASGHPTPLLLKLMRDVVSGIAHLHELGIIHRDLKPQNVLIIEEKSLCAKLSDMGISKRLLGDMSSLGHLATGCGSSGWQAPEQLLRGRQTRAVDLFSLGCVLFFCITGGKHPFGDHLERDVNITKNQKDLFLVEYVPEALDLISGLLNPQPELRPNASEVLHHPLFWNSEMRLSFLRDVSDRVELEDRENESDLLKALESTATTAIGGKWDDKVELAFIVDMSRYRRYKFHSVRDLLRLMRNKLNHYRELPKEIQQLVGPVPEGFDGYFTSRFPGLLIEVYKVVCRYCREEECFQKYFTTTFG